MRNGRFLTDFLYFCRQVSPMRRKRRELRQVPWVQGGGMIFVEYNNGICWLSNISRNVGVHKILCTRYDTAKCPCDSVGTAYLRVRAFPTASRYWIRRSPRFFLSVSKGCELSVHHLSMSHAKPKLSYRCFGHLKLTIADTSAINSSCSPSSDV